MDELVACCPDASASAGLFPPKNGKNLAEATKVRKQKKIFCWFACGLALNRKR